jgi:hypothetical protein
MAASRASATKTMFGIPAPDLPQGFTVPNGPAAAPVAAAAAAPEAAAPAAAVGPAESETGRTDRIGKTGARKTAVPAPEIRAPEASAAPAAAAPAAKEVGRTTHFGYEAAPKKVAEEKSDRTDKSDKVEKTKPTRAPAAAKESTKEPAKAPAAPTKQAPIWTYVGVGFTFGLALLGIYQLVGRLAH